MINSTSEFKTSAFPKRRLGKKKKITQRADKTGGDYISHQGSVLNPHCYMKTTVFFQGRNVCEQTFQEIQVIRDTQRTLNILSPQRNL